LGGREIVAKNPKKSALSLLEARILLVDHQSLALADDDLAVAGTALDAGTNLHGGLLRGLLRPSPRFVHALRALAILGFSVFRTSPLAWERCREFSVSVAARTA
jgi:hypothetical protein